MVKLETITYFPCLQKEKQQNRKQIISLSVIPIFAHYFSLIIVKAIIMNFFGGSRLGVLYLNTKFEIAAVL